VAGSLKQSIDGAQFGEEQIARDVKADLDNLRRNDQGGFLTFSAK